MSRVLSILIYHSILETPDPLRPGDVDATTFQRQIRILSRLFNILPLSDAVESLRDQSLPPRAVCITFDDGYADNATRALPILRKQNCPATFFVATGYLDGGCMWNDMVIEALRGTGDDKIDLGDRGLGCYATANLPQRLDAVNAILSKLKYRRQHERHAIAEQLCEIAGVEVPPRLMMTTDQVKQLAQQGMEIGGHTVNHPILRQTDKQTAQAEIADGKQTLESITGKEVRFFAYPNGRRDDDYDPEHVQMVRDTGFQAALTTEWGTAGYSSDLFQLPRFTPWDKSPVRFAARLGYERLRSTSG